ncbi:hypothetical protein A6X21_12330 [Planctopirus hydrillae]|uniref:Uncharacterized protein n=1 Tax=Planctopirus hydrillae TaxID=1841610 RepID=A0A1C3E5I2_9PLAN|nr:hypothetical protein A6X21_12330 [Planctopirus hydrillae]
MRSLLADWFTTKGTKNTKEIQSQIVVSCRKYRTKSNQDVKVAEKALTLRCPGRRGEGSRGVCWQDQLKEMGEQIRVSG